MTGLQNTTRKFHDAWAFLLFLAVGISINTFLFINKDDLIGTQTLFPLERQVLLCILSNLGATLILLLLALILCFLMPKILILLSVFAFPAGSIAFFMKSGAEMHEHRTAYVTLAFILNFLFLMVSIFAILMNLSYIAAALRSASKLFFKNIFSVLTMLIVCCSLLFSCCIPCKMVNSELLIAKIFRYTIFVFSTWVLGVMQYFLEVFVSSIVFFQIKKENKNVFINSLINSLCALGSISLGALVFAVVSLLNSLIRSARKNNDSDRKNGFIAFFLVILESIVKSMENFVEFANNIAFPYLSINGTNYSDSVSQSYQALHSSGLAKIASYRGLTFVSFILSALAGIGLYLFNSLYLFTKLGMTNYIKEDIMIIVAAFTVLFYIVFSLLQSFVMALIFAASSCKEDLQNYDPKFVKEVDNESNRCSN